MSNILFETKHINVYSFLFHRYLIKDNKIMNKNIMYFNSLIHLAFLFYHDIILRKDIFVPFQLLSTCFLTEEFSLIID